MKNLIIVVDDSATVRKFVSFALEFKDYDVIVAEDGMDALEKMSLKKVDLAIVDLNMPVMDGYELIETLRKSEEYRDLPIIILSTERGDQARLRGEEAGANHYLIKPFDKETILNQVSKYLAT